MRNSTVNHSALKAAQSKAVIARFLGDGRMWQEAHEAIKTAINMPWYRKS
jgi:hypothetical protein